MLYISVLSSYTFVSAWWCLVVKAKTWCKGNRETLSKYSCDKCVLLFCHLSYVSQWDIISKDHPNKICNSSQCYHCKFILLYLLYCITFMFSVIKLEPFNNTVIWSVTKLAMVPVHLTPDWQRLAKTEEWLSHSWQNQTRLVVSGCHLHSLVAGI